MIFTAWADNHIEDMKYKHLAHENVSHAGGGDLLVYRDALEIVSYALDDGYRSFIMIKTARDVKEVPRVTARLKTDAILEAELTKGKDGIIYGKVIGKRDVK